jgi:hypothetical protein
MSTHRTSSKAIATLFVIVGVCALIVVTAVMAAGKNASTHGRGFQTGSLRVGFTDDTGQLTHAPLSRLSFDGTAASGQRRSYSISIEWPSGPKDNAYQGQSLSLSLRADAQPAQ